MTGPGDRIQSKIYRGMGKAASKLGKTFQVWRNGILINSSFLVAMQRTTKRDLIEAPISLRDIIFMDLTCDASTLQQGDVLVGPDPGDRYILATKSLLRPVIAFRCDLPVKVRRPMALGGDHTTNKASYGGRRESTDQYLVYNAGTNTYSFSTVGTEATVYASRVQWSSTGPFPNSKIPLDTQTSRWYFAMEILPGVTLQEDDYIYLGTEYYQIQAVDDQRAGMSGQVVYCNLVRP